MFQLEPQEFSILTSSWGGVWKRYAAESKAVRHWDYMPSAEKTICGIWH